MQLRVKLLLVRCHCVSNSPFLPHSQGWIMLQGGNDLARKKPHRYVKVQFGPREAPGVTASPAPAERCYGNRRRHRGLPLSMARHSIPNADANLPEPIPIKAGRELRDRIGGGGGSFIPSFLTFTQFEARTHLETEWVEAAVASLAALLSCGNKPR